MSTSCSANECARLSIARGLCKMHWKRWRKHGDANYQRRTFWGYVEKRGHNGCWLWTGNRRGRLGQEYGSVWFRGKHESAHRVSWIKRYGEIPKTIEGADSRGTCVLHKCDTPLCVNPKHLFLGTNKDNMQDKVAKKRDTAKYKKHCKHGHRRTTENTWTDPKRGLKHCRVCSKLRMRRVYRQQRRNLRCA